MIEKQEFTKQSNQNPNESRKKNIKRIDKEKSESDNPIKKDESKSKK